MGETTKIEWADKTFSPWTGCTKISPACQNCYAANMMANRFGRVVWGEPGVGKGTRSLMSDDYWKKPLAWNQAAYRAGTRPFVFPSLCDPFDNEVDRAWFARFVGLMWATPHLVWLLLTKRPGNILKMTTPRHGASPLPQNVALGATLVNQEEWDRDLWKLADACQSVNPLFSFVSIEPMLGPIIFKPGVWLPDWMIVGGETDQGGRNARYTHPDLFRSIRDQTARAGKIFFMKQMTRKAPIPADLMIQNRPEVTAL